jgi:hypothetical protein
MTKPTTRPDPATVASRVDSLTEDTLDRIAWFMRGGLTRYELAIAFFSLPDEIMEEHLEEIMDNHQEELTRSEAPIPEQGQVP